MQVARSALLIAAISPAVAAAPLVLNGPAGSQAFGDSVTMLPNGNFVVLDPTAQTGGVALGAAHLYAPDGTRLSTLRGASAGDGTGLRTTLLPLGDVLVVWPGFDTPGGVDAGAVVRMDADTGLDGVVSAANALLGAGEGDGFSLAVTPLRNGHYVVALPGFDGAAENEGAVRWCDGALGCTGAIDESNSLTGSSAGDLVGSRVARLANGHYVAGSAEWDDGETVNVGALAWCDGDSGCNGTLSAANALIGGTAGDRVGNQKILTLDDGDYVVLSTSWRNGAVARVGAATWGNGNGGTVGAVSPSNSLIGAQANDNVGVDAVELANGNYVVISPSWDNGVLINAGAATWGDGDGGTTGFVSAANSLVGAQQDDLVSQQGVAALANGHYVVLSSNFKDGATVVSAATWGDGEVGSTGLVTTANSTIGNADSPISGDVGVLANGHYVLLSPSFDLGGTQDVGAATWRPGDAPSSGTVSAANSITGSLTGDQVGVRIAVLPNGHYVLGSNAWNGGRGAVTWLDGSGPQVGVVDAGNSLIGGNVGDQFGSRLTALANGDWLAAGQEVRIGGIAAAGAIAIGDGESGRVGIVDAGSALVGASAGDRLASLLIDGGDVLAVGSAQWDGTVVDGGIVTLMRADGSTVGVPTAERSVFGAVADSPMRTAYDPLRRQLAVGERASNRVSLLRFGLPTSAAIVQDGPDPSFPAQAVTVRVTVASTSAATGGRVEVIASSGETCTATAAQVTSPTTSDWTCQLAFAALGERTLSASYFGDGTHAFGTAVRETHRVLAEDVFANGFEGP